MQDLVSVMRGNATKLPFEDNSFNIVIKLGFIAVRSQEN